MQIKTNPLFKKKKTFFLNVCEKYKVRAEESLIFCVLLYVLPITTCHVFI